MTSVAILARGWIGDTLACVAAATSLCEAGYSVDYYYRWPQLDAIFRHEKRFKTRRYHARLLPIIKKIWALKGYHHIVEEPIPWSYKEPFTSEIRRLAGCEPTSEFSLTRPPGETSISPPAASLERPRLCISRDIVKRSYGRHINELVSELAQFVEVSWVGLDPRLDSKKGQKVGMEADIQTLISSAAYFGPEGGMLWLAAGLGVRTIYLTEHIHALEQKFGPGVHQTLGMANVFPRGEHLALAPGLPNREVVKTIVGTLGLFAPEQAVS